LARVSRWLAAWMPSSGVLMRDDEIELTAMKPSGVVIDSDE
jgi:hypothetical protein